MRLVLADRHAMFVDALAGALEDAGDVVLATCTSPDDLGFAVATHQPDACLVDASFLDADAVSTNAAVAEARATSPGSSIVLLAGAPTTAAWGMFDDGRVDGLVSKSTAVNGLVRALLDACAGRRPTGAVTRPAAPPARGPGEVLTDREHEALVLMADGASTEVMATSMGVSTNTVRSHVQSVLHKLGAHRRGPAVMRAVELGLVDAGAR
jgi:two-component system nitrate/nitrite response regulator NarL